MFALLSFLGLNFSSCDTEDFNPDKELFDIDEIKVSINEFEKELNKKNTR